MSLVPGLGELPIHNDEGKVPHVFSVVTSDRVNYHQDTVDYLVNKEVNRCKAEDDFTPTPSQVDFLRRELIRHVIIRRDIMKAQKIRLSKQTVLKS